MNKPINNVEMKVELTWVNSIKCLCLAFIFLYHCEYYSGIKLGESYFMYSPFYTNIFFFISGYLLFRKQLEVPLVRLKVRPWYNYVGGGRP